MHKIAIVQTDMTYKNINSIETLNKACSSQLLNAQKEKEKMQKLYEEKITSLNNYIKENIKPAKKEKEKNKNNKNKEKEEKEKEDVFNNLNTSLIFLPEMISPENTYKIFIHCVKHFKYEEDIYKKYLEEGDLYILKAFMEKMEKYLIGAFLTLLKNKKSKKGNKICISSRLFYSFFPLTFFFLLLVYHYFHSFSFLLNSLILNSPLFIKTVLVKDEFCSFKNFSGSSNGISIE